MRGRLGTSTARTATTDRKSECRRQQSDQGEGGAKRRDHLIGTETGAAYERHGLGVIFLARARGFSSLRSQFRPELRRTRRSLGEGGHPTRELTLMRRRRLRMAAGAAWPQALTFLMLAATGCVQRPATNPNIIVASLATAPNTRSEERRVGKECRL